MLLVYLFLTGHLHSTLFQCLLAQLLDYIKSTVHSANAVVGTCKMGAESDEMAVVNSALQVSTVRRHPFGDWVLKAPRINFLNRVCVVEQIQICPEDVKVEMLHPVWRKFSSNMRPQPSPRVFLKCRLVSG